MESERKEEINTLNTKFEMSYKNKSQQLPIEK